MSFFGLARTLSIDIYDATGTTLTASGYSESFTGNEDYGWQARSANLLTALSGQAGNTVQVRVNLFVPENFTGPSRIGVDNMVLTLQGGAPLVPTMSQWGLIILGLIVLSFGVVMIWKRRFGVSAV